jgi:hypothetical protein
VGWEEGRGLVERIAGASVFGMGASLKARNPVPIDPAGFQRVSEIQIIPVLLA